MYLIALAIAPGIAISLFIYSLRSYDKGPRSQLLITFLLGMVATVPAYLLQTLTADVRVDPGRHSILSFVWFAFVAVAFSEEGCKFLVLRIYAFPRKAFQEPLFESSKQKRLCRQRFIPAPGTSPKGIPVVDRRTGFRR